MSRAIVIFARAPECEAASKRLPVERGAHLFRSVITAWLRAAQRAKATPIIACPAEARPRMATIAADVARLYGDQCGATFGERLANSSAEVFALGFQSVVITGIDVAPPDHLDSAFRSLDAGRSVIAPARDGGVNLIGLRSPARELLSTFALRDPRIADRCRRFFGVVEELPLASDIDSLEHVRAARRETAWSAFYDLLVLREDRLQPVSGWLKPSLTLATSQVTRAPPIA
jgi:glycosyltransferase A (GT-A) superfamily protein (DUF2064 family)